MYHHAFCWSPPTRVVWIEIMYNPKKPPRATGHHPHGWCGLKCPLVSINEVYEGHHPHGWCGLKFLLNFRRTKLVSHHPHGWCGLKSKAPRLLAEAPAVTTHTGGVDWNSGQTKEPYLNSVTTHTGGVDWNCNLLTLEQMPMSSPPTRVVWIEIFLSHFYDGFNFSHHPHGWCGLK